MRRRGWQALATGYLVLLGLLVACGGAGAPMAGPAPTGPVPSPSAAAPAAAAPTPWEPRAATIGLSNKSPAFLVSEIAHRQGYFEQHGLRADLSVMPANLIIAGLESGEVDYIVGLDGAVTGAVQGLPLKVLACFDQRPLFSLLVAPGITSFDQLKGATWAVNSLAGGQYIVTRELAKQHGWDPMRDIGLRAIGQTGPRLAALEAGTVQATLVTPDAAVRAQDRGLTLLMANAAQNVNVPWSGLAAHQRKLDAQREEVRRVLRAMRQAAHFILDDAEGTARIMADWLELEPNLARRVYPILRPVYTDEGTVNREGLDLFLSYVKEAAGRPDSSLRASDILADDILQEL